MFSRRGKLLGEIDSMHISFIFQRVEPECGWTTRLAARVASQELSEHLRKQLHLQNTIISTPDVDKVRIFKPFEISFAPISV